MPNTIGRAPDREGRAVMAPFQMCSYDIEAYSPTGDFPDAANEDDIVTQIGMTFASVGEDPKDAEAVLLCVGECADIEGAEVECFDEEVDMIKRWAELLQERCVTRSTCDCLQLNHSGVCGATLKKHPVVPRQGGAGCGQIDGESLGPERVGPGLAVWVQVHVPGRFC